jgi:hypothetical protein
MQVMPPRPKPGDLLDFEVPGGIALAVYVGRHRDCGDAISVWPKVFPQRPRLDALEPKDAYVTFYPARAAQRAGLVHVVGSAVPPPMPGVLRRAGARAGTRVETWVIERESGDVVRGVLSDDERRLPIAALWNHEFLVARVVSGWQPTDEG